MHQIRLIADRQHHHRFTKDLLLTPQG